MKNYSGLSDFEINKLVAKSFHKIYFFNEEGEPYWLCPDPMSAYSGEDFNEVLFDPCNNPSDSWPIIVGNKISTQAMGDDDARGLWHSESRYPNNYYCFSDNPLRAAMIVYLMMKDNENENSK